ncbi:tRNA (adenosine(37)-N6)-dimethylallyltransferase MiaA [bacterium]|nr:tRNA (adenosine(37)-N6)-dimethylallyltransferase MiaA [bacterium]
MGPTASGKTAVSIEMSRHIPLEIVSADSRQIFRFMNVGTAKPGADELAAVPHHCIDICDPDQYFSAGEYAKKARACVRDILDRHRLPVVVGGSGLYIRALVDGVFGGDFRDADLRRQLKEQAEQTGWSGLHRELAAADPVTAARVHENDHKRIIRALEVYRLAGVPISRLQQEETIPCDFNPVFFGLRWPKPDLAARIDARVNTMIGQDLVGEVRSLLAMGFHAGLNSMNSVGYKEIIRMLSGELTQDTAVAMIRQNTRRFAKKQMTWFNRETRIHWMDMTPEKGVIAAAAEIMSVLENGMEFADK